MSKKSLLRIIVTSNGQRIGTITTDEFRKAWNGPRNQFLTEAIEQFNAAKVAAGEPERVSMEICK